MAWEGRVRKTTEEDVAHTVEGANKALFTQAQKKREEREQSEPRRVNKNRKMISSHLYHRASSLEFVSLSHSKILNLKVFHFFLLFHEKHEFDIEEEPRESRV
jgi:hypothetical protein